MSVAATNVRFLSLVIVMDLNEIIPNKITSHVYILLWCNTDQ